MNDDDMIDGLQDVKREIVKLSKAVLEQKPPVVNVETAKSAPPVVNVAAPVVHAPVTVEREARQSWHFTVTERDNRGFIKAFTATPTP